MIWGSGSGSASSIAFIRDKAKFGILLTIINRIGLVYGPLLEIKGKNTRIHIQEMGHGAENGEVFPSLSVAVAVTFDPNRRFEN